MLESLIGKSLVFTVKSDGDTRFSILETLREYALEKLTSSGREQATRMRHARYFGELAETVASRIDSSERGSRLDRLELEHDNLRAALGWRLTHDPEAALAMSVALEPFWLACGYGIEAEKWLSKALGRSLQPDALRATGLLALSSFRRRSGDAAGAAEALSQAERIAILVEDTSVWLKFHNCAGWHSYDVHNYDQTLDHFERGLLLARAQNDHAQIVRFLTAIVHLQRDLPDLRSQVIAYLDECLDLLRELDDTESLVFVLQQYGIISAVAKDYLSAQNYYRKMLEIHRSTGNKLGLAWALSLLAEAAWFQRDLSGAQQQYERAYILFVEQDNVDGAMIILHHLGQIARQQGRIDDAVSFYCSSLNSAATLNNRHMVARCLAGLGGTEIERTNIEQAAFLISAAHRQFDTLPPFLAPYDLAELEHHTARVRADIHVPAVSAAWDMGQITPTEQVVFATLMKMSAE